MTTRILLLIAVWFGLALMGVLNGVFAIDKTEPPIFLLTAVWLPPLLLAATLKFSTTWQNWLKGIDINILIIPHAARWTGMGFIVLSMHKLLPVEFAYPAGLGDAMAAIGAMYIVG